MRTKGNTILITGGATGIGFALAEAFVKAGNKVLICGRREARLKEAKAETASDTDETMRPLQKGGPRILLRLG